MKVTILLLYHSDMYDSINMNVKWYEPPTNRGAIRGHGIFGVSRCRANIEWRQSKLYVKPWLLWNTPWHLKVNIVHRLPWLLTSDRSSCAVVDVEFSNVGWVFGTNVVVPPFPLRPCWIKSKGKSHLTYAPWRLDHICQVIKQKHILRCGPGRSQAAPQFLAAAGLLDSQQVLFFLTNRTVVITDIIPGYIGRGEGWREQRE